MVKLVDGNGAAVVEYMYDSWGKQTSCTGTLATTLGVQNPFRYRGYFYDAETGWYYLQSRYYNPEVGRFLSADALMSTGQGVLGYNMYAYCGNNPVNRSDPSGCRSTHASDCDCISCRIGRILRVCRDAIEMEASIGGGIGASAEIDSFVGVEALATADILYFRASKGTGFIGTRAQVGGGFALPGGGGLKGHCGTEHSYLCDLPHKESHNSRFSCPNSVDTSDYTVGYSNKDGADTTSWIGFSASVYMGVGGSFSIRINVKEIFAEVFGANY